jgi:N-acetyl-beta-hexosaminidase
MFGVTDGSRKLALGVIACTWSEEIPTMQVFGDRTYPRLAAFSFRTGLARRKKRESIHSELG